MGVTSGQDLICAPVHKVDVGRVGHMVPITGVSSDQDVVCDHVDKVETEEEDHLVSGVGVVDG